MCSQKLDSSLSPIKAIRKPESNEEICDLETETDDTVFDLKTVYNCFSACLTEDGDIYLDNYLSAYKELKKYVSFLGQPHF